jgi:thymidine kinase
MQKQLAITDTMSATLTLFIGPMFSGKTSRLIEKYRQCVFCQIPVIVINHRLDTRYDETLLSSHDNIKIPCVRIGRLVEELLDSSEYESRLPVSQSSVHDAHVIIINEGQFFDDLRDFVEQMLQRGKQIFIAGLDGDFKRQKFGQILDLIPLCDDVIKLKSICSGCKDGTLGVFSKRITTEMEQTVVGAVNYIPVCRRCYEVDNINPNEI